MTGAVSKPLWPLPYDYHLKWRGHTICVAEGVVYDPILESPVPLEDYPKVAFGTDILVRKSVFDINPTLYAAEIDGIESVITSMSLKDF